MPAKPLLEFNDCGIYCPQGDFYIDPWKPVKYAIITHAHSDHAKPGHQHYLSHHLSRQVLLYRLGDISIETIEYNQQVTINGVKVSLHPAGHIIGSAQVRIEYKDEIWVASGDYKLEDDGISTPFEPVKCHSFISESTFGLPVFKWQDQQDVFSDVNRWWKKNLEEGRTTVIAGYSLGKAQRILQNLDVNLGRVFTHGAVENMNEALRKSGIALRDTTYISYNVGREEARKGILICPPSAIGSPWLRRFQPLSFGYCSGWMTLRGAKRRTAADRGFVISDHADWDGLLRAIRATECETVYLTHGYTAAFSRYLCETGLDAREATTLYGGDEINEQDELPAEITNTAGETTLQEGAGASTATEADRSFEGGEE